MCETSKRRFPLKVSPIRNATNVKAKSFRSLRYLIRVDTELLGRHPQTRGQDELPVSNNAGRGTPIKGPHKERAHEERDDESAKSAPSLPRVVEKRNHVSGIGEQTNARCAEEAGEPCMHADAQ